MPGAGSHKMRKGQESPSSLNARTFFFGRFASFMGRYA